jgi:hypothetical protein
LLLVCSSPTRSRLTRVETELRVSMLKDWRLK